MGKLDGSTPFRSKAAAPGALAYSTNSHYVWVVESEQKLRLLRKAKLIYSHARYQLFFPSVAFRFCYRANLSNRFMKLIPYLPEILPLVSFYLLSIVRLITAVGGDKNEQQLTHIHKIRFISRTRDTCEFHFMWISLLLWYRLRRYQKTNLDCDFAYH